MSEGPPKRVVSLLAAATEIVHALGRGDWLVGRSHECDFPPSVACLPACSAASFPIDGASGEIDRSVRGLVREGLALYRVDAERLRALAPDVVLTQTQCEVCAVAPHDLVQALCSWTGHAVTVVSLEPHDLAGVWADFGRVAHALACPEAGEQLLRQLRERIASLAATVESRAERPSVVCLEWLDPLIAAGNWMPELVALAGGRSLFGEAGRPSPPLEWEELHAADPDVILATPCGFDLRRTRAEIGTLQAHPGFLGLRAVREGRLFAVDGNAFFHRSGPRLVESLGILVELLHPGCFTSGLEGSAWARVG